MPLQLPHGQVGPVEPEVSLCHGQVRRQRVLRGPLPPLVGGLEHLLPLPPRRVHERLEPRRLGIVRGGARGPGGDRLGLLQLSVGEVVADEVLLEGMKPVYLSPSARSFATVCSCGCFTSCACAKSASVSAAGTLSGSSARTSVSGASSAGRGNALSVAA